MIVYILLMMLPFYIPMLFPSFVRRHFYNEIRIIFGGVIYCVPYMILIQWFPQGNDLSKLYLLLIVSFFWGLWLGKIIPPWTVEDGKKNPFNGGLLIVLVVCLLLFWILINLDINNPARYAVVVGLVLTTGIRIRQEIIE